MHILYLFGAHIICIWCAHHIFGCTHNVLIRMLSVFGANIVFYFVRKFHYLRPTFYLFLHEFNIYCANIIFIWCAHYIYFVRIYFNWVCFVHTWYLFAEQLILFCSNIKFIIYTHYIIWCAHYIIRYAHY